MYDPVICCSLSYVIYMVELSFLLIMSFWKIIAILQKVPKRGKIYLTFRFFGSSLYN